MQLGGFELLLEHGVDAVAAVERFDDAVGAVDRGDPRAVLESDTVTLANERAGQSCDRPLIGLGVRLAMHGANEPEHAARELQHDVLEPAAHSDQRYLTLAGV